jgi:serine/threonine protein kinase
MGHAASSNNAIPVRDDARNDWDLLASNDHPRKPLLARSDSVISCTSSSADSLFSKTSSSSLPGGTRTSLASFDLLRFLGAGSHGRVYLARHIATNKLVAIKVMRKSHSRKTLAFAELETLKSLARVKYQCPYICPLLSAFHSPNKLFLVFEYLSGGELYFHLGKRGRMPETLAKFYMCELVLALGFLHSQQLVYCDLKPENIVLDGLGHCHLVDFGLCRSSCCGVSGGGGTTGYLAPEVQQGEGGSAATDWWALGMVFFEMLTGLPPWFHDKDPDRVVEGILHGDTKELNYCGASEDAQDLIHDLLRKDPAERLGEGGAREVMSHAYFKTVDWVKVAAKKYEPPFVPPMRCGGGGELDDEFLPGLCNFDVDNVSQAVPKPSHADYLVPACDDEFEGFVFDAEVW